MHLDAANLPQTIDWLKPASDDLKAFYIEAMTAQPGSMMTLRLRVSLARNRLSAALIIIYEHFQNAEAAISNSFASLHHAGQLAEGLALMEKIMLEVSPISGAFAQIDYVNLANLSDSNLKPFMRLGWITEYCVSGGKRWMKQVYSNSVRGLGH